MDAVRITQFGKKNTQFQLDIKQFGHFNNFFLLFFIGLHSVLNISLCSLSLSPASLGFLTEDLYLSASWLEAPSPPVWKKSFSDRLRLIRPHSPCTPSSQLISSPSASPNTARAIMCQVVPSYYSHDGAASSAAHILNICNWIFL